MNKIVLDFKEIIGVIKALDNPHRKNIINTCLNEKSHKFNILQLQKQLNIKGYANFHRHIKILSDAGLIDAVKDPKTSGQAITISIDRKKFDLKLIDAFKSSFNDLKIDLSISEKRKRIVRKGTLGKLFK